MLHEARSNNFSFISPLGKKAYISGQYVVKIKLVKQRDSHAMKMQILEIKYQSISPSS